MWLETENKLLLGYSPIQKWSWKMALRRNATSRKDLWVIHLDIYLEWKEKWPEIRLHMVSWAIMKGLASWSRDCKHTHTHTHTDWKIETRESEESCRLTEMSDPKCEDYYVIWQCSSERTKIIKPTITSLKLGSWHPNLHAGFINIVTLTGMDAIHGLNRMGSHLPRLN